MPPDSFFDTPVQARKGISEEDWLEALDGFAWDETEGRHRLREMAARGGEADIRLCVPLLAGMERCAASVYLAGLLSAGGSLAPLVCDPVLCSLGEATRISEMAAAAGPGFDLQLLRYATAMSPRNDAVLLRVLSLLRTLPVYPRLLTLLVPIMRHGEGKVRAQAALVISRVKRDAVWVRLCLKDPDPRVRAHAVEGLWGVASAGAIQAFLDASRDPHHRVAANGLVGMHRAGLDGAAGRLIAFSRHLDPGFQAAAAWAMGECGSEFFEQPLREMLQSEVSMVRRCALRALIRIRKQAREAEVQV